ncbi:MAG: polysaccharide biosynthesis C-terminal domain-containing protein [Rhodopila sp.]|nr:polysaccharide biosynthesis C-terminal domain-containing protein [Rhodopila sp.]
MLVGRLARSSLAAFSIHVAGAGMTYLSQLVVARLIGPGSYGIYAYVLAWVTVLSYGSALGFDISLLRFVSAYRAEQAWPLLRGAIQYAERRVILAGLGIVLVGSAVVTMWPQHMSRELMNTFLAGFLVVPILALLWIRGSVVRALGGVVSALAPDRFARDGILLCLIALAGWIGWWNIHAPFVMVTTLASSVAGLGLVSLAAHARRPAEVINVAPAYAATLWRRTALPLVIIAVSEVIMNRTGVMLLGSAGHITDAGIYALAFNLTFIVTLPRSAINALFAPMIADLFVRNDRTALQLLITKAAFGMLLASLCIALPLGLLAEPLLTWFGRDFGGGLTTLRILLIGQVIMAGAGSQLFVMTMTGHERGAAMLLVLGVIGNAVLGAILIRSFGMVGAAIANTVMLIVWNAAMAIYIWRKLQLAPGLLMLVRHGHRLRKKVVGNSDVARRFGQRLKGMPRRARWLGCAALLLASSVNARFAYSHVRGPTVITATGGFCRQALEPWVVGSKADRLDQPTGPTDRLPAFRTGTCQ